MEYQKGNPDKVKSEAQEKKGNAEEIVEKLQSELTEIQEYRNEIFDAVRNIGTRFGGRVDTSRQSVTFSPGNELPAGSIAQFKLENGKTFDLNLFFEMK